MLCLSKAKWLNRARLIGLEASPGYVEGITAKPLGHKVVKAEVTLEKKKLDVFGYPEKVRPKLEKRDLVQMRVLCRRGEDGQFRKAF